MRIDHIAMVVTDIEAAKNFFTKYFGAVANEMNHNPKTGLKTYFLHFDGNTRLEIMQFPNLTDNNLQQPATGYCHLAISTGSKQKVDETTARLRADGFHVVSGPRTTGDGYYESCVEAIESNLIEITE